MIFGVGPGSGDDMGGKSIGISQGGWRSFQCGPFKFLWQAGWTNGRNGTNGAFLGQISML